METGRPPAEFNPAETYRTMARLCYEQYVYLVTCATQNPEGYEPYPPDVDGYVSVELGPDEKRQRLESVLTDELRTALKNMIANTSKSLGQPKLPLPSEPSFEDLVMALEQVIRTAELDDIANLDEAWWGDKGPPNPLKHPLNIVRMANTAKWRKLPLNELLDDNQLHPDLNIL